MTDHYTAAEHELANNFVDPHGQPVRHVAALAHAVLALIDKLDELPVVSLCLEEYEEEYEE